jgi:Predicted amidohydrolase
MRLVFNFNFAHKHRPGVLKALMSTLFSQQPQPTTYRVAAIQYEPTLGEKEKNIRDLLRLVEEAATHDARLIVLPALATTGASWLSSDEIAPYVEPIPGPTTERFLLLAQRYQCYIAFGMPEVDLTTNLYYNSLVLLGPAGVVGSYRKIHADIGDPRWARDGDQGMAVWDTPLGRIGGLVCTDMKYFEAARCIALQGADVLVLPANWTEDTAPSSWWMSRAFENGMYVVVADRYGRERGVSYQGGSCVIEPTGVPQVFQLTGEGIVYGQVDLARSQAKAWRKGNEILGYPLADRVPGEYRMVAQNGYLWEPLRYHGLYELGELPAGQLSCAGIVQWELHAEEEQSEPDVHKRLAVIQDSLQTQMHDNAPAVPDVLVLPELVLPGPVPAGHGPQTAQALADHYRAGAIQIPGPETDGLVAIAKELQVSLVVGVAERAEEGYYNTVLLLDPEGVYGFYRKIHLSQRDKLWALPGNLGLPTFDTPAGRIGLATGYDVLFPETLRVLANKGTDLVCAPALLDFPDPVGLTVPFSPGPAFPPVPTHDPFYFMLWRTRAAEHNVYLALANWFGESGGLRANGLGGIFSPAAASYGLSEVLAEEDEGGLMMMTIDTREQRTGRRTTHMLGYSPGDMAGSLTGELAYNVLDAIPGNAVRSKPLLRKRQPYWYLDIVRKDDRSHKAGAKK